VPRERRQQLVAQRARVALGLGDDALADRADDLGAACRPSAPASVSPGVDLVLDARRRGP
jgi:hypothetical protein